MKNMLLCYPINPVYADFGRRNYYQRLEENERFMVGPFYCARSRNSHTGQYENAIDFLTRLYTPVRTVASGTVIAITENNTEFGQTEDFKNRLNEVVVGHSNGLFSQYAHIEKGSVTEAGIKVGGCVYQGQEIGRVGHNGLMYFDKDKGPLTHLHFMLFKVQNGKLFSVPCTNLFDGDPCVTMYNSLYRSDFNHAA